MTESFRSSALSAGQKFKPSALVLLLDQFHAMLFVVPAPMYATDVLAARLPARVFSMCAPAKNARTIPVGARRQHRGCALVSKGDTVTGAYYIRNVFGIMTPLEYRHVHHRLVQVEHSGIPASLGDRAA